MVKASKLPINTVREGTTADDMAQTIFGNGAVVTGATYYGDVDSAGTYSRGDDKSPNVTPSDTGVILSTGNAESFTNNKGEANQRADTSENTTGIDNFGPFNQFWVII